MMFLNDYRSFRLATILIATGALLGASACSSDGSVASDQGSEFSGETEGGKTSNGSDVTTSTGLAPFADGFFEGTDEQFYVPPDPLPAGEPGELIRVMKHDETKEIATVKVMYHSRDATDRDRPTTALVSYRTGPAPKQGWPVVATAPGTTGLAPQCGVSRQEAQAPDWGVEGVAVMTDYIGLGAEGGPLHPYFSKPSEGHSVIDGVRAARQLADVKASDRWLAVGHSQGGHGALSASELAEEYAPELALVGTLALAPAAMFEKVYGGIDPIVTGILTAMSLYGGAGEHAKIELGDYVSDDLAAASDVFETGCLPEITDALIPLAASGQLFTHDPRGTEPANSILLENDVGHVVVDAPLFLVSGTADDRVVIDRVRDLYSRLCETGQLTELLIIEGATHGSIISEASEQTSAWLNERLEGEGATDSCTESPPSHG